MCWCCCCVEKSVSHVDSHINVIINGMLVYRLDVYFNLVWSLWLVKIQELSLLLLALATLFMFCSCCFSFVLSYFLCVFFCHIFFVCIHFSNSIHIFVTHFFPPSNLINTINHFYHVSQLNLFLFHFHVTVTMYMLLDKYSARAQKNGTMNETM